MRKQFKFKLRKQFKFKLIKQFKLRKQFKFKLIKQFKLRKQFTMTRRTYDTSDLWHVGLMTRRRTYDRSDLRPVTKILTFFTGLATHKATTTYQLITFN